MIMLEERMLNLKFAKSGGGVIWKLKSSSSRRRRWKRLCRYNFIFSKIFLLLQYFNLLLLNLQLTEKINEGEEEEVFSLSRVVISGAGFLADAYDLFVINVALDLMKQESYNEKLSNELKSTVSIYSSCFNTRILIV